MEEFIELKCKEIQERRSSRLYIEGKEIEDDVLWKLLKAFSLAPSGKNTQPWRVRVIKESETIQSIANIMPHNQWVKCSSCIVAVYIDTTIEYDESKSLMAVGAAIQNMLLEAEANEVGACWIGECLEYREEMQNVIDVENEYRLLALVSFGYERRRMKLVHKKKVKEILI